MAQRSPPSSSIFHRSSALGGLTSKARTAAGRGEAGERVRDRLRLGELPLLGRSRLRSLRSGEPLRLRRLPS